MSIIKLQQLCASILDLIFVTALIIFIAIFCGFIAMLCPILWRSRVAHLQDIPKTPEQLIEPLTQTQQECVMSLTTKENLVYAEKQSDPHYMTLGYKIGDKLHAVVVMANEDSNCQIVFDETFIAQHYDSTYKITETIRLIRFGMYDLTHDGKLDIFLGEVYHSGKFGTSYTFYTQQPDGSYKNITSVGLICTQLHIFDIIEMVEYDKPIISISHDLHCDFWRGDPGFNSKMTEHIKFMLTDTGIEHVK